MQFLEKLWKTWEDRNINFFVTERRRNYSLPEPHYYTIKCFIENLLAIEMKKKKQQSTYDETSLYGTFNTRIK